MSKTKISQNDPAIPASVNGSLAEPVIPPPGGKIDFDRLAVNMDFASLVGTRETQVTVPVGKPGPQTWVQLHPEWRYQGVFLELKDERTFYLLEPKIVPDVREDCSLRLVVPYATRESSWGLWLPRLPGEDGRLDSYSKSAQVIAHRYSGKWIRIFASPPLNAFKILESTTILDPARWPEEGLKYLLQTAFEDRLIDNPKHPVLQRLGRA
jgi:hypothetical protein